MDHQDWEAWDAAGAAARVRGARRRGGEARGARARRRDAARAHRRGRCSSSASMAAVVALTAAREGRRTRTATWRRARGEEVRVGGRAIAVLEPGAHVKWDGDAIEQTGGDVFWRVEPGARFVVHTPAADVTVKGTCFRVKVSDEEDDDERARREVSGAVGAVLAATAFVGVYEGKVAVSHAGQSVDLVAGQSAQANAQGVKRVGGAGRAARRPVAPAAASATEGEQALTEANANLADNVRDYRRKLEALEAAEEEAREGARARRRRSSPTAARRRASTSCRTRGLEGAREGGRGADARAVQRPEERLQLRAEDPEQARPRAPGRAHPPAGVPAVARAHLGDRPAALQPGPRRRGREQDRPAGVHEHPRGHGAPAEQRPRTTRTCARWPRSWPGRARRRRPARKSTRCSARTWRSRASRRTSSKTWRSRSGPDDAQRVVYGDQGCWWNSSHGVGPRGGQ